MKLTQVSPGFDDQRPGHRAPVAAGALRQPRRSRPPTVDRILERVSATPGIFGAEAINQLAADRHRATPGTSQIVGRAVTDSTNPLIRDVTPGYFALMRIPLFEGRTFLPSDTRAAQRVVAVNRTLARHYFPDGDAIGQRIVFEFFEGRPEWTIVGVVGDEQFDELDHPMVPVVYFPFAQDPEGRLQPGRPRRRSPRPPASSLRAAVAAVDPDLPLYGLAHARADGRGVERDVPPRRS